MSGGRWAPKARRRWCAVAAVALCSVGSAEGAAFVPGRAEPDPPTGDQGASRPAGEEPVAAGNGIRWRFGPWRYTGSLGLDLRWSQTDDKRQSNQIVTSGLIQFGSYVWQPWFIQVRAGLGLVLGRSTSSGGDGGSSDGNTRGVTGNAQVVVFPLSRFPFEVRADVGDSRATGDTLVNNYRTYRFALKQAYRPPIGSESYMVVLDHSRINGSDGSNDTLTVVRGTGLMYFKDQILDLSADFSDNQRDNLNATRQWNAAARHTYTPATGLHVESLTSWNRQQFGSSAEGGFSNSGQVWQISSVANWRPQPGDWLYSETSPMTLAGSARVSEVISSGQGGRTRLFGLNAGAAKQFSQQLRANVAASYNRQDTAGGGSADLINLFASASYSPAVSQWGEWRYAPSLSSNLGVTQDSGLGNRTTVAMQASHSVTRNWAPTTSQSISFSASQSVGYLVEMPTNRDSRGLSHSAGLHWQLTGEAGTQSFAGLTVTDSRTQSEGDGRFQFINLQITRRSQLSRFNSWSANFTAQGSRSSADVLDAFTGELRRQDNGWQRSYSGSLSYESQRAFGIPRLRFTALATANTQQLDRRSDGNPDAPLERVTESLEARLDYAIGRLDTRLAARAARVDGRSVYAITARAQRNF